MFNIRVIKADLWENVKEGFDNNEEYEIGNESSHKDPGEKKLKTIAKDYFEGRFLARSENRSLPMRRRDIAIDWLDSYDDNHSYEINHAPTGTYLGRLEISQN